jgi:2-dehydropantoate 2-reductase
MRVAVLGPGAVGCLAAAALRRDDPVAPELLGRRAAGPIVVERADGSACELPGPRLAPTSAEPFDLVLFSVKAHQVLAAGPRLRDLCGPATLVAALQNGVEQADATRPFAGEATVLPVVAHCSSEAVAPGAVRARTGLRMIVPAGADGGRFAACFDPRRATVERVDDWTTAAWRKLCGNLPTGLAALVGRDAPIFRSAELRDLARRLVLEGLRVARAAGARLDDAFADEVAARFAEGDMSGRSSIVLDRLAGRPLEWDARNGVVRRLGALHGVPTPITDVLVPLLAACDP